MKHDPSDQLLGKRILVGLVDCSNRYYRPGADLYESCPALGAWVDARRSSLVTLIEALETKGHIKIALSRESNEPGDTQVFKSLAEYRAFAGERSARDDFPQEFPLHDGHFLFTKPGRAFTSNPGVIPLYKCADIIILGGAALSLCVAQSLLDSLARGKPAYLLTDISLPTMATLGAYQRLTGTKDPAPDDVLKTEDEVIEGLRARGVHTLTVAEFISRVSHTPTATIPSSPSRRAEAANAAPT